MIPPHWSGPPAAVRQLFQSSAVGEKSQDDPLSDHRGSRYKAYRPGRGLGGVVPGIGPRG